MDALVNISTIIILVYFYAVDAVLSYGSTVVWYDVKYSYRVAWYAVKNVRKGIVTKVVKNKVNKVSQIPVAPKVVVVTKEVDTKPTPTIDAKPTPTVDAKTTLTESGRKYTARVQSTGHSRAGRQQYAARVQSTETKTDSKTETETDTEKQAKSFLFPLAKALSVL